MIIFPAIDIKDGVCVRLMQGDPDRMTRRVREARKPCLGFKILGAGRLRDRADECLQYALGLDCVDCFTIGSENREELAGLLRKIPAASIRG